MYCFLFQHISGPEADGSIVKLAGDGHYFIKTTFTRQAVENLLDEEYVFESKIEIKMTLFLSYSVHLITNTLSGLYLLIAPIVYFLRKKNICMC